MAVTDVEINICGARDLKNVNWKHGDLCAYAVAWINDGAPPTKVTTRVDASGDTNPSWEQRFTLSVRRERLEDAQLIIEIYHDESNEESRKAIVGRASLSLLEVMDAGGYNEERDYSVKLKRPSGRPHGKLDVAVRLRERRGAYNAPPPAGSYGRPYYNEGGQANRDWQPAYPGYSSPYPPQPYAQNYPSQPYPYGGNAPPQAYGSYGGNPSYGAPASQPYGAPPPGAPASQSYGAPPPDYYNQPQSTPVAAQKSNKFGGLGAGLAVGALAGAVGGIALDEFVEHKEDEAADEQAEEDADRYGGGDYGGGDDYGYGDDY